MSIVTITDISQGPSVTRYELQPEQGVKVSKIVGALKSFIDKNFSDNINVSALAESVGISEVSDSLTIIVSEETGKVSIAQSGKIIRNITVENLRNEEVKGILENRVNLLNKILKDNQTPQYEGVNDEEVTKEDIILTITDDTEVIVTVELDGNEYEYKDEMFTEEGVYKITLTDEAFNSSEVNFTIDKTAPVFENLENNK